MSFRHLMLFIPRDYLFVIILDMLDMLDILDMYPSVHCAKCFDLRAYLLLTSYVYT